MLLASGSGYKSQQDTLVNLGTVLIVGLYSPSSSQFGYSLFTANGPLIIPVPNKAHSKEAERKCLLAPDSSS